MRKSVHSPEYGLLRAELRRIRKRSGLSQRDLAAMLTVPHTWVAKIETGERRIDLIEFCWLVAACDEDPVAAFKRVAVDVPRANRKRAQRGGGRR